MTDYKDKFVAFVDIVGFSSLVDAGTAPDRIIEVLACFGDGNERARFEVNGPTLCPCAPYVEKDLDFRSTQASDSVVASAEVSPAGVINLIEFCWAVVLRLLQRGIMCRGYINRGPFYHTDTRFFGTSFQQAVEKEKMVAVFKRDADDLGTPFVEVSPTVTTYVNECGDACVGKMFSRLVKHDGDLAAIYPFQRLRHSFMIGGLGALRFDPQKELHSNNNLREWIKKFIERVGSNIDRSNLRAVRKAEHYLKALHEELELCDHTDAVIRMLDSPLRGG